LKDYGFLLPLHNGCIDLCRPGKPINNPTPGFLCLFVVLVELLLELESLLLENPQDPLRCFKLVLLILVLIQAAVKLIAIVVHEDIPDRLSQGFCKESHLLD
jgi:hypothetical protein